MRPLKVCLWVGGILCLLGVFGLFLPLSVFESLASSFGIQEFPDAPVFTYIVRVTTATYIVAGIFCIILARDPMKYGVLVPLIGLAGVFLGVVCGISGIVAGMPVFAFVWDFLSSTAFGVLILVFWQRARKQIA